MKKSLINAVSHAVQREEPGQSPSAKRQSLFATSKCCTMQQICLVYYYDIEYGGRNSMLYCKATSLEKNIQL